MTRDKDVLCEKGLYERTIENEHGCIEIRECFIWPDIDWLHDADRWAGLSVIGVIVSKREELGKEPTINRHYFIYSPKDATATELLRIKRSH